MRPWQVWWTINHLQFIKLSTKIPRINDRHQRRKHDLIDFWCWLIFLWVWVISVMRFNLSVSCVTCHWCRRWLKHAPQACTCPALSMGRLRGGRGCMMRLGKNGAGLTAGEGLAEISVSDPRLCSSPQT